MAKIKTLAETASIPHDEASLHKFAAALALRKLQVANPLRQKWDHIRHPNQTRHQLRQRRSWNIAWIGPRAVGAADLFAVELGLVGFGDPDSPHNSAQLSWEYWTDADKRLKRMLGAVATSNTKLALRGGAASLKGMRAADDERSPVMLTLHSGSSKSGEVSEEQRLREQDQLNATIGETALMECGRVLDALATDMGYEDRQRFFARQPEAQ